MNRWTLLTEVARQQGVLPKSLHKKTQNGTWIEYTEATKDSPFAVWKRAPDGRIYISLTKFDEWVEHGQSKDGQRKAA